MAGTDKITLFQPPESATGRDKFGQPRRNERPFNPDDETTFNVAGADSPDAAKWTAWTVWAVRVDRGGREKLAGEAQVGNWVTRFEIRCTPGLAALDAEWALRDVYGRDYDIESVQEKAGTSRRYQFIFAVRREPGGRA